MTVDEVQRDIFNVMLLMGLNAYEGLLANNRDMLDMLVVGGWFERFLMSRYLLFSRGRVVLDNGFCCNIWMNEEDYRWAIVG